MIPVYYVAGAAAACVGALALLAALDRDRAFAAVWAALRRRSHAAVAPLRRAALAIALALPDDDDKAAGAMALRPAAPPLPPPGRLLEVLELGAGFGDCVSELVAAVAAANVRAANSRSSQGGRNADGDAPRLRRITLVEPNTRFHAALRSMAVAAAAAPAAVRLLGCGGEDMAAAGVENGSVDLIFSHLVLCSCPAQAGVLAAAWRALRPGGRLVVVEHVRGAAGSAALMAQRAISLSGLWALFGGGCRLDRDTGAALVAAGPWARLELREVAARGVPFFLQPHIVAVAER
jgi:SAM-dependent methyltransferase